MMKIDILIKLSLLILLYKDLLIKFLINLKYFR
jgi:hypothetical protein